MDTPAQRSADLRLATGARSVRHITFDHRPPRFRGTHHQFDGIAGPAVGDAEREQRVAAGDPHRRDVVHRQAVLACAVANTPPRCLVARATASAAPAPGAVDRWPCPRRGRARRRGRAAPRDPASRRHRRPRRSASSPPPPRHVPPTRSRGDAQSRLPRRDGGPPRRCRRCCCCRPPGLCSRPAWRPTPRATRRPR